MVDKLVIIISSAEATTELGVQVAYVGTMISDLIRDGFVPMVW